MRVVSLFDGISCGQIALQMAGIPVEKYFACEIKKSAIKVTQHNYPETIQMGDVRNVCWQSIGHCELLLGGSPCQDFSIANNDRLGLQGSKSSLFWQFVKAKEILKPKYFLFENVAMPKNDFETVSKALCTYPVNINSETVSAQTRNRFYWTNIGHKNFNLFGFPTCAIESPPLKTFYSGIFKKQTFLKNSTFRVTDKRISEEKKLAMLVSLERLHQRTATSRRKMKFLAQKAKLLACYLQTTKHQKLCLMLKDCVI